MDMRNALIAIAIIVVLGVAYYGLSPLFRNSRLDEAAPAATKPSASPTAAVVGTSAHPASGTARIVSEGGAQYLRYEDFKTLNGPDLYVYLSKDLSAREFVDLGRLKATEGNINYAIPAGVDPKDYPYALVWCKAFGVLFNSAALYENFDNESEV
ncbi:MAG TPA: DM13 domain-containing protein [Candidatus Paceibacterota bacterium]|nr:DM13 domain-containing protein [Candidatus Paceibacterota bacterium]